MTGLAVVGVGASAGGLQALEAFFSGVPAHSGLAFLVVQHLDPKHKAMLAQLLQRITPMTVVEAQDRTRIAPDCVYVIPPNRVLTVVQGRLHTAKPELARGMHLPIDALFSSLALEYGEDAIGVVLSGMGSDGTRGLTAIKAAGGLALAQDPATAQFDSMPRSAIGAQSVHIVAAPQALAGRILAATGVLRSPVTSLAVTADDQRYLAPHDGLTSILRLLRDRGKHDFSLYKASTLQRRIERRMGIHGVSSMTAYAQLLLDSSQELELLFKELLIGVTGFFRDTPVWQRMKDDILPALVAQHPDGHRLRAWVVGCSTGEEAYSLAMAFREVIDAMPSHSNCTLQIFATDLSMDAIDRARRGCYPLSIAGEVSAARLARFFVLDEESYRIDKRLRETVVFAPHDVTCDPPFMRLDLLSCRNLLIYFTAPLQRRLLPLFHYSLRPGGVLLLGSSETVGRFDDIFEPIDAKLRCYRRLDAVSNVHLPEFPVKRVRAFARALDHDQEIDMTRPSQTPPQPAGTDAEGGAAVPEKAVTSDGTGTPESAVAPASAGSPEGAVAPLRSATPDMAAGTAAADGSEHSRLIAREPSAIVLESIQAIQPLVDQLLLREYSPPAVLVNSSGDIVYINGRTGRYLEPAAGRANWNIHVMGRNGLREPLSNALLQAVSQQSPVELRGATVEDGAQTHRVDITVRPLYAIPALEGMVMILFREMSPQPKRRRGRLAGEMQFDLETQLQEAREHIQAQREEMRISQE